MLVQFFGIVTEVSPAPIKALVEILVSDSGSAICDNAEQSLNALLSMLVSVAGSVMVTSDEQPIKALSPMEVTLSVVSVVSFSQP